MCCFSVFGMLDYIFFMYCGAIVSFAPSSSSFCTFVCEFGFNTAVGALGSCFGPRRPLQPKLTQCETLACLDANKADILEMRLWIILRSTPAHLRATALWLKNTALK